MTWKKDWDELVESSARAEEDLFRRNLPDGTDDAWRNAILQVDKAVEWMSAEVAKHDRMKRDSVSLGVMAEYHPCKCMMCNALRAYDAAEKS